MISNAFDLELDPHFNYNDLTKNERWKIADELAEDRLPSINAQVAVPSPSQGIYVRFVKRIFDIIVSLIALIITLPINLIITCITLIDVGRPILFRQKRTGKDGKPFELIKFRNMKEIYDENGDLLPPEKRVTKWGKFVRKTSLDELLNFWSVLKGDMSIIGPRPLPEEYYGRYSERHKLRLKVRPGLECPTLLEEYRERTWNNRLENDVWYVANVSFLVDIKLCFALVKSVFDKESTDKRSKGQGGTFMGYDSKGKAITLEQVPNNYIQRIEIERKHIVYGKETVDLR